MKSFIIVTTMVCVVATVAVALAVIIRTVFLRSKEEKFFFDPGNEQLGLGYKQLEEYSAPEDSVLLLPVICEPENLNTDQKEESNDTL